MRSLATIVLKGQNKVEPFKVSEKIMDLAEVKKFIARKLFLEICAPRCWSTSKFPRMNASLSTLSAEPAFPGAAPKSTADQTDFTFPRAEIDKKLENLQEILQAARVVPEIGLIRGLWVTAWWNFSQEVSSKKWNATGDVIEEVKRRCRHQCTAGHGTLSNDEE